MRYVMVLIPNVADARDVVQEAAVALWDKIELRPPNPCSLGLPVRP